MTGRTGKTRAAVAVAAALLLLTPIAASAVPTTPAAPALSTETSPAQDPVSAAEQAMRYRGGRVLLDPRVYVVFWGSEWGPADAKGMPTVDPLGVAPTVVDFFSRLGGKGDTWSTILTQYCSGTKIDDKSCGSGSRKIQRLAKSPLRGWWVDTSPGPNQSNNDTQTGAWHDVTGRALDHFGATHPDDIVVLMLPPGHQSTNCSAFHTVGRPAPNRAHPAIVMPYPVPGPTCLGRPPVCDLGNPVECLPETAITIQGWASHEYAEVVTNPFPKNCLSTTGICGWIVKDAPVWASRPAPLHTEISDTCSNYRYVQLNGEKTVVATLWSNTANKGKGGCVARYVSDKDQD